MSIMKDFRSMTFVDQIRLLTDIQVERKTETLPDLIELFRNPLNDTMVDHLVKTALNSLLAINESEVVRLLEEGTTQHEKTLCVAIAGNCGFAGAVPVLHKMLENGCQGELLTDILQTLSRIAAPESMDIFRKYFSHENDMTAAVAIEAAGNYRDINAVEALCSIITRAGDDDQYELCSLQAGMAVQSLAAIGTDDATAFLAGKIHHRNATLRRHIQDCLIKKGADAIPFIAPAFDSDDNDSKILAANILGFIRDRKGGDVMVKAMDAGKITHPNVRYAVYEAFGRISFLKGITCLVDALNETDDFILMAVVTALNEQVNQGVINSVRKILDRNDDQGRRLRKTIAASKAVSIFKNLYEDEKISSPIIDAVIETDDPDAKQAFSVILSEIQGERAVRDIEKLSRKTVSNHTMAILAVDDSRAMLSFYRSTGAYIGGNVTIASNGKEAIDTVDSGENFDIVITDMNMPVMDGVEFTRKLREKIGWEDTPVIMVTTESEESQKELARKAGVNAFITKPFTKEILKEKIDSLR